MGWVIRCFCTINHLCPLGCTCLVTAVLFWGCAVSQELKRRKPPFQIPLLSAHGQSPLKTKAEWKDPDLSYLHMWLCKSIYCFLSHGSRPAILCCRRASRSVPQWRRLDYRKGHMCENRSSLHIHSSSAGTWEKGDLTLHCQRGREEENGAATRECLDIVQQSLFEHV